MATIEEYLATLTGPSRAAADRLLEIGREETAGIEPGCTEVISYGIPTFKRGKLRAHIAAWPHHASMYPVPRADEELLAKVTPYIAGKGTLRFSLDEPLPEPLIREVFRALLDIS